MISESEFAEYMSARQKHRVSHGLVWGDAARSATEALHPKGLCILRGVVAFVGSSAQRVEVLGVAARVHPHMCDATRKLYSDFFDSLDRCASGAKELEPQGVFLPPLTTRARCDSAREASRLRSVPDAGSGARLLLAWQGDSYDLIPVGAPLRQDKPGCFASLHLSCLAAELFFYAWDGAALTVVLAIKLVHPLVESGCSKPEFDLRQPVLGMTDVVPFRATCRYHH